MCGRGRESGEGVRDGVDGGKGEGEGGASEEEGQGGLGEGRRSWMRERGGTDGEKDDEEEVVEGGSV